MPAVNAYRRLDPHFEARIQLKASPVDRWLDDTHPIGNERSMRVEVRSVRGCQSVSGDVLYFPPGHIEGYTAKIKNLPRPNAIFPTIVPYAG